jgi:hypothetical protein
VTSRSVTVLGYAGLALLLVALEVTARLRPEAVAPVAAVVRRVCRTRSGQLFLVLAWWWLGWHFLLGT